jgi:hypothetical protein
MKRVAFSRLPGDGERVAFALKWCCFCLSGWCRVSESNRRPTAYRTTSAFAANPEAFVVWTIP